MSVAAKVEGTYRLPESATEDLDDLKAKVAQYQAGAISDAQFRVFRVPLGIYEQRQKGRYMLRIRLPGGGALPGQMRALAAASREYGNGVIHMTTRQDAQVHDVPLDNVHPALEHLAQAGLSAKGGGGNTVRNITACPGGGVCAHETFDLSPCAVALTEYLLPDSLSYQLPRKYKIALAGCARDCGGATVSDLGCIAKRRDGELGFTVYVGGGMGARSRPADRLEDFVPADEIHLVAEAVKRVFDQHGNRKNRHKARLRFLLDQIGLERFRELYHAELDALRAAGIPPLQVRELPLAERPVPEPGPEPSAGFARWREKNVRPQRQQGYHMVDIPLVLGNIPWDTLEKLAGVVDRHGEGLVRGTLGQELVIRWVHENELPVVHRKLADLGLAGMVTPILSAMTSCSGTATCPLGLCRSSGLSQAIDEALVQSGLDLDEFGALTIKISGCPDSCGRHPVADIGFFGAARRVNGHLVPHYILQLGGRVGEGDTRFAEGKTAVPARNVPALVVDLLRAYRQSPQFPNYGPFLEAGGRDAAARLAAERTSLPPFEKDPASYRDWGSDEAFSLAGRGPGECGAGVFDLIEVDLAGTKEALEAGRLAAAAVLAARALLVTQGQEAEDDAHALRLFTQHFVDAGLVPESLRCVVEQALASVGAPEPERAFEGDAEETRALVDAVKELYDNMDPSLRFSPVVREGRQPPETGPPSAEGPSAGEALAGREEDLLGLACSLSYVKTKRMLDQVPAGQVVAVLLDQDGARNVPESVARDGHEVLATTQEERGWRVLIRKGPN